MNIFTKDNIIMNQTFSDKEEAINAAGRILADRGYVQPEYIESMQKREKVISTYVGNKIAIPHGINGSESQIMESGISLLQVPQGVSFGKGKTAYIVIGIAGKNNTHMSILTQLSEIVCDVENVDKLIQAKDEQEILDIIGIK
ncbi:PTS sugar transporter subunit IIA [Pectinatus haikarae]|uniref:Mannitol-specific phosphotransferase enzyme IIA component n=1 Tax=Pectinatus haikarae TaxID=349096 RepID=A0ABT9Y5I2_9FIRM|nr:PTS sugar transporter subunit IIA [Pectinatus haikarae]MDQ0202976.1 mannitol/fructose-specific phosphotransferase system IIA component [Pectinatus haikarae]